MNVTWVMLEKNKQIYKYPLLDNEHLFNKDLMNLQIEGWNTETPMDYHDIFCIKTQDYYQEIIEELPHSLRVFQLNNSNLMALPTFNENIQTVQIINSKIELTDLKMEELKKMYPQAKINITNFPFMEKKYVTARNLFVQRRNPLDDVRMFDIDIGLEEPLDNVLNTSQTVHLTSINKCILDAIRIIETEFKKYQRVINPIQKLFIEEPSIASLIDKIMEDKEKDKEKIAYLTVLYDKWYDKSSKTKKKKKEDKKAELKKQIEEWYSHPETHSVHKCSFKSLFVMIMTIIENHEQKEDMKKRLIIELEDSMGLCFTGRINRMVNSLVGFIEGIQIGLSTKEEIQMKISMIIRQLTYKKITKKQAKEEIIEMFSHVGEKENISNSYKEENLVALEECFDDDEEEEEKKNKKENK